jgi:hypothetical protein
VGGGGWVGVGAGGGPVGGWEGAFKTNCRSSSPTTHHPESPWPKPCARSSRAHGQGHSSSFKAREQETPEMPCRPPASSTAYPEPPAHAPSQSPMHMTHAQAPSPGQSPSSEPPGARTRSPWRTSVLRALARSPHPRPGPGAHPQSGAHTWDANRSAARAASSTADLHTCGEGALLHEPAQWGVPLYPREWE